MSPEGLLWEVDELIPICVLPHPVCSVLLPIVCLRSHGATLTLESGVVQCGETPGKCQALRGKVSEKTARSGQTLSEVLPAA